jgi:hypothetical protein
MKTLIFVLLISSSAFAGTYYVDPNGRDSDSGSEFAPWQTAHRAVGALSAGDTLYFRKGDYLIKSILSVPGGVKLLAYPGEIPRIVYDRQVALVDTTNIAIVWVGTDNVTIDGLTIIQTEASRAFTINELFDMAISIYGRNAVIRNCTFLNTSGVAIYINGPNALIENNKSSGTNSHAFYIAGAYGTYRDNDLDCVRGYKHQFCLHLQYKSSIGNKIYRNVVKNGQMGGIVFSGMVANNEVFNNVFINNGIQSDPSFYGATISFTSQDGPIQGGNKFYNNTIIGKRPNSGLIQSSNGEAVEIYNNIFSMSQTSDIWGSATYTKIKNNVFYNVSGAIPAGNITTNPLVANPAGLDANSAKIQLGSSAINRGIGPAPIDDYLKMTRSVPDIGAFEFFSSTSGQTPPLPPTNLRAQ